MKVEKLLNSLIKILEEEKKLIILSIKDKSYSENLLKTLEEKKKTIEKLSLLPKEDFKGFEDKLQLIKSLSEENLILALNNIQFIEDIFEAIFKEETKTYSSEGNFSKEPKSLINKKI